MGDESKTFVRMENLLSCRFALLVLVALVSGCMWMVEQPGTSLLRHAPYYIHLLTNCGPCFYKRTWMGLYGAKSCKATQLFGSAPMIMDFESHLPKPKRDELKLSSKGMVKRTICKNNPEKVWVTGDVGLRSSQAYPKKFAKTMVKFFNSQDASVAGLMPKMFEKMQHMYPKAFDGHGLWDYAALDSLKTFLKAEQHAGRFKPQGGLPYDD